jgi:hypothetical protein
MEMRLVSLGEIAGAVSIEFQQKRGFEGFGEIAARFRSNFHKMQLVIFTFC